MNEPGLYALVLGSRKPEAKAFKRWITHEVIPSIRKAGSYTFDGASKELQAIFMLDQPKRKAHSFFWERRMRSIPHLKLSPGSPECSVMPFKR